MNRARLLASISALTAVGCLWLFPIKEDAKPASVGMAGAGDEAGISDDAAVVTMGDEPECTGNADCILGNSVCRAGKCLDLASKECLVVKGAWDDPNAYIFGAYAFEPPAQPQKSPAIYNYALAIKELNSMGGLPDKDGKRHPLAVVICNNDPAMATGDPEFYHRSLDHLVGDLGISAIVADLAPATLADAFHRTQTMMPKKNVFFLSPGATNKDLLMLGANGLVWSMLGPPSDLAPGYASLVQRIEAFIRASDDAGTTPLRVATVVSDNANEVDHQLLAELLESVRPLLFFNAASATSAMNKDYYREFHIDATRDGGTPAAVGDTINAWAPHIVISMTGTDFTTKTGVANQIITRVGAMPGNDRWLTHEYPFFIESPINAAATNDFNITLESQTAQKYDVLFKRILGITIAGAEDRDLYKTYLTNLRNFEMTAPAGFENYYDAIYYLAYSVYVEGVEKALDGAQISAGMARMSSGMVFEVGPTDIEAIFAALQSRDVSMKLIGAGGSLFDVPNAVRINQAALYCFEENNGSIPLPHLPAEIFNASSKKWQVIFQCTPGL